MKIKLNWLAVLTLVMLGTSVAQARPTIFCRDCPFPAKVADGRWVMANGIIQIEIDETVMPRSMSQVDVVLRDTRTGNIVAKGVVIQRRDRRTLMVDLMDRQGRQIKGFVYFVDERRERIQAKFTCEECSISPMLD
jgi:hypothetical protein